MKDLSDKELIENVVSSQSEQHFCVLVNRHSEALYWSIRKLAKSHQLTDDIMQNTWVKVWKNIHKFEFNSAFYTWLFRIGRNETYTLLKKESKNQTVDIDDPVVQFNESSPFRDIDGETISKFLQQAVEFLPEKQKIIFELKYFEEKKYNEISSILGISEGGAKASYFHAVKKIEENLRQQLNHLI